MDIKKHRPRKHKWTDDAIRAEAVKYEWWNDFREANHTAYVLAHKTPNAYPWLKHKKEESGYWTKERVFWFASHYKTRSELKKANQSVYRVATKNKWLDEMSWLGYLPTDVRYWSKDLTEAESRKYTGKGRKAFQRGSAIAYGVAKRNGWLDDFTWLTIPSPYETPMHSVYQYEFEDGAIYVGLTCQLKERDKSHRGLKKDLKSSVYRYAKDNGYDIPPMRVVARGLTIEQAQIFEEACVIAYRSQGIKVLNKGKVGLGSGSIGGLTRGKWSKAKVLEVAQGFTSAKRFEEKYPGAYEKARKMGWLSEMPWRLRG